MGKTHSNWGRDDLQLVNVNTDHLKARLNKLYETRRHNTTLSANDGLFEYLWDLKELALMEGKPSVEVPSNWLEELEESTLSYGARSH